MNLLLDIGNTNLRWVLQVGNVLGEVGTVRHGGGVPLDLLAAWEPLEPPGRVLLSNVGGEPVTSALRRVVRALWGIEPEPVAVQASCLGLRVAYADPSRLGVDRWLALLGAQAGAPGSALVVDAGTAVTYDLMLAGGRHLGGLILPGIALMRSALLQGTHLPPLDPDSEPGVSPGFSPGSSLEQPWGADTAAAVAGGGVQALGALAERLYDRLAQASRMGAGVGTDVDPPRLLLTGGDAERLAPLIGRPLEIVPDLVLRGLARLAQGAA